MRAEHRDIAVAAMGLALVLGCVVLAHLLGVVYCPLRRWAGIPCPFCGTVRACFKMLGGDFADAFAMQPLGSVIAVGAAVGGIACLFRRIRTSLCDWGRRHTPAIVTLLVGAALVNWIYVLRRQSCL